MSRPIKVILVCIAASALAVLVTACGTEKITVPTSDPTHQGAVLFSQRCAGCHTLSYAGTHGSAANVRTAQANNGPNFDVRCERPITRVLYAIENGGFSGAIMPQNIVVGQDARLVSEFVSKYAGRQAATVPGVPKCEEQPIGTLPPPGQATAVAAVGAAAGKAASSGTAPKSAASKGSSTRSHSAKSHSGKTITKTTTKSTTTHTK